MENMAAKNAAYDYCQYMKCILQVQSGVYSGHTDTVSASCSSNIVDCFTVPFHRVTEMSWPFFSGLTAEATESIMNYMFTGRRFSID